MWKHWHPFFMIIQYRILSKLKHILVTTNVCIHLFCSGREEKSKTLHLSIAFSTQMGICDQMILLAPFKKEWEILDLCRGFFLTLELDAYVLRCRVLKCNNYSFNQNRKSAHSPVLGHCVHRLQVCRELFIKHGHSRLQICLQSRDLDVPGCLNVIRLFRAYGTILPWLGHKLTFCNIAVCKQLFKWFWDCSVTTGMECLKKENLKNPNSLGCL